MELFNNININKYIIKLVKGKQLLYGLIYTFSPVQLETLKTYIQIYLKTMFIWLFKFPIDIASIIFNNKPDSILWLYIHYRDLSHFIVKNRYPLPVIGKSLH